MDWKPIETAPKDGSTILLWIPSSRAEGDAHPIAAWWGIRPHGWHARRDFWCGSMVPTFWAPIEPPEVASQPGKVSVATRT